jgi:predicted RNase H-like nuclease (RuvC/YqgF family)
MREVFSQSCSDIIGAYVKASLKRDHDAREIYLFLEERLRRDRRLMRRRIARLEQEQAESYRSIEELAEEVERLNVDLERLRASPVDPVSRDCVCCELVAEAQPATGEEVQSGGDDWTQI